jgi:four helix bundle protein
LGVDSEGFFIRKSSNSAPANLAEGWNNKHLNIYLEGINRANGEIQETGHHLSVAFHKGYLSEERYEYFVEEYDTCGKMLSGLEKSLSRYSPNTQHPTPNTQHPTHALLILYLPYAPTLLQKPAYARSRPALGAPARG